MANRSRPQVCVFVGGMPVAELPEAERRALAERIARTMAHAAQAYAELEWQERQAAAAAREADPAGEHQARAGA